MTDWNLPYVRWADVVRVEKGGFGARERRIYDHELVYVLVGRGRIVLNGVAHLAVPDSLFLVQPGVWHSFEATEEAQQLLGVHFDWESRTDVEQFSTHLAVGEGRDEWMRPPLEIESWNLATRPFLDLRGRPRVRMRLESAVNEQARGDRESKRVAGALLAAALSEIAREVRLLDELASDSKIGPDAVRRVQRARELLEENAGKPLSIEEVARRVGWSGDHLRRMCRAVLGDSPAKIQTTARIRRAQELLRYGEISVAEVGRQVGFEDASHFTRVFKNEVGQTPREWLAARSNIVHRAA